jgi:plasmid stabilization system protein ParE
MKLRISRQARRDLQAAHDYIALDSPAAAERLLDRFREVAALLGSGLVEGREVLLISGEQARAWSWKPYRIYYRRHGLVLEILRVYHQSRKPIEQ